MARSVENNFRRARLPKARPDIKQITPKNMRAQMAEDKAALKSKAMKAKATAPK